ncbi:MAG: hypothetical protein LCH73_07145 [Proteobacteria bacterium]|nr:hypothetical protein [Pseudomonadota bacterium]
MLFEVSTHDIAKLSDADLRSLVARLCIARLADAGLPSDPVTWGGDQRAPDGGIDVRVQLSDADAQRACFPASVVGYQVKATRMRVNDIRKEMCPGGLLRPSIRELILGQGAYIIATSDSATDSEYNKRVAAMQAAISEFDLPKVKCDFYDAQRLADWTNRHPGLIAWVQHQLGRPRQGWQPYGQWADTRGGIAQPFLPDDKHRLSDPLDRKRLLSLVDGLQRVRQILGTGGRSVRLTGLSGTGKTRFAQALFEESAASGALPQDVAAYTDTAHSPEPSPLALLDELITTQRRAILIVDNCGSQLHNQLTTRCKKSGLVSLLTIEYDIREDLPQETNVFLLEAASSELIEKLIKQQFPDISPVNVRTIADFADGNSRVAAALANTMDTNDSLAGLTDRELFDRLFWLGKEVQQELKVAAEACALVYSFDGEDIEGELSALAALAGRSAQSLYRPVSELQNRGLIQRRGRWRAVLPHAISNALACQALEAIPYPLIHEKLVASRSRLLSSFSRRLGYLHASQRAVSIVRDWLSEDGFLGDVAGLSPRLLDVLINVAPVDPAASLQALRRGVNGQRRADILSASNASRSRLVKLVRSIAYEPEFFEDCLEVLEAFARAEPEDNRTNPTRPVIASLFTPYLSGTHATKSQRADWIRKALQSGDAQLGTIGLNALSSALGSDHFSSHYGFEFGARVRDYGANPRGADIQAWFRTFIELAVEIAQGDHLWADGARELLARHFRSLWTAAGMADVLEVAAGPLLDAGWEQGWFAVQQTIRFDSKTLPADIRTRLHKLEERARPKTLVARVKAIVLDGHSAGLGYSDGESASSSYERAELLARELGESVATDADAFKTVLPLIVIKRQGRHRMFGAGLASKVVDIEKCWNALTQALEAAPEEQRNVQTLRGFLSEVFKRDRSTFEHILDDAMRRAALAQWVPVLQLSAPLDELGCARLLASMNDPAVSAWMFQDLDSGRATHCLADRNLAELLQRLSIKPDGEAVVIGILYMHIYDNPNPIGPLVIDVARNLIAHAPLSKHGSHIDHELAEVIGKFAAGPDGEPAARGILTALREGLENFTLSRHELNESLAALCRVQPLIALDTLVGDETDDRACERRHLLADRNRPSVLAEVPVATLVQWCQDGPSDRWIHVALLVPAFGSENPSQGPRWSEHVLCLLRHAPEPARLAESMVSRIVPPSWWGSLAGTIRRQLPLLDELAHVLGPEHADRVAGWTNELKQTIDREARRELEEHRAANERFE